MKKVLSLTLSLALAASLAVPALANETDVMPINETADIMPISAPISTAPLTYAYEITVNGEKVDTSKLPAADEGYIPGRAVAEADYGSAYWSADENSSYFYFEGLTLMVNFADNSISVGEEKLEGTAIAKEGVTYLPLSVLEGVEGFTLTTVDNKIDLVTPNNDPLIKLGYSLIEDVEMACRMKDDAKAFFMNLELDYEKNFESGVTFMGMNINPDTLVLGKMTKDADMDAIKEALETFRKGQEETFSWYMGQHLPKVQAAKTFVNGDYVMFTICEDYDKAEELFNAWVAEQE